MNRGYIKLYRCIHENYFWQDKPFDMGRAWIDLLLLANHTETCLWKRGIKIIVGRGQVGWSERELAKRWGWSRGKVERFLKNLKNEHQIEQQNGPQNINVTSLITIVNYDKYQSNEPQNGPQNEPQTGHKQATNRAIENELKNEKNENEKTSTSRMTINDFRFLHSDKFGSNMPGGCNATASELCNQFTKEEIVRAFDAASVQGKCTVAYVKGVLLGNGIKPTGDVFDPNKDYPEGSFMAVMKADYWETEAKLAK